MNLLNGDCKEKLKELPDNSIDGIVTDPPYFLINKSGGGFMGKEWDSINIKTGYDIICKSTKFASFAEGFFRSMMLDSSIIRESSVHSNANTKGQKIPKSAETVRSVEKKSLGQSPKPEKSIHFAQDLVLTGGEVLDLLSGLSQSHTRCQNQKEWQNALFVLPVSTLRKKLTDIVPDHVLKFPIEQICLGKETPVSLTDEARINGVIEGMIGNIYGSRSTNGTTGGAESVKNTVGEKKFRHIILSDTEKPKIIRWIIWLLYAMYVMSRQNTVLTNTTLSYDLIYQFHCNWLEETLRVLKPGAFACIMSSPRQDVWEILLRTTKDVGFNTEFSGIKWAYATGFPKAGNTAKYIDKKMRSKPEIIGTSSNWIGMDNISPGSARFKRNFKLTKPTSKEAKKLDGSYLGFQPKPAVEEILVCMKPLSEKSYVDQALSRVNEEEEILKEIEEQMKKEHGLENIQWT